MKTIVNPLGMTFIVLVGYVITCLLIGFHLGLKGRKRIKKVPFFKKIYKKGEIK